MHKKRNNSSRISNIFLNHFNRRILQTTQILHLKNYLEHSKIANQQPTQQSLPTANNANI